MSKQWKVYLAGEIHSDWRERIAQAASDLPVAFTAPVADHAASDNCGIDILGPEESSFWKDRKGAQLNAIRTRTLIRDADLVVVRFGDQYRQWNAAFDAGFAAACNKPLIVLHPPRAATRAQGGGCGRARRSPCARASRGRTALCHRKVVSAAKSSCAARGRNRL